MFQPPTPTSSKKLSARTNALSIQGASSAMMQVDLNEGTVEAKEMQNGEILQAQSIMQHSQKLEDDLRMLGTQIKQRENNINHLNSEKSKLDGSIIHLQVTIGKSESSSKATAGDIDNPPSTNDEEVDKQISQHEKSAAGILCQLKIRHGAQASHLTTTKDVVGIVATLGKVEDDNLSRLLSEYLGVETMLAIVCKTYEGVKALEMYDKEGCINKSYGLHGLGASIGRALDGRFLVICLEYLRPYAGNHVVDDAQRKLDILNPRLPNGECPAGFLGFAVNMINVDSSNLFCVTPNGYGLRETLFYNLFSRLQVYKTRAEMIQALPCISEGALSLDGGIIRSCGVFTLGNREDIDVRFPRPERSMELDNHHGEISRQLKEVKWKKEKILEELKREQTLLDMTRLNFNKKKGDYLKYLAQSSSNATQIKMVRNVGGGIQGDRVRLTTSVKKRRHVDEDEEHVEHEVEPHVEVKDKGIFNVEGEAYPGGPVDGSLLRGYKDHVARQLWNGVDRGELKLVSHGRKINKMSAPHAHILDVVKLSGLASLVGASYDTIDKGLLCAFVERWHADTNTFHLPIGELTITLDDVSNLLHLPIIGQFYTYPSLDATSATNLLVESLCVDRGAAAAETRHCRGGHVRLSWLREIYEGACNKRQWTVAARAYLLHLVGCTIFADKSATSVSVCYMGLFIDLRHTGRYSWAAAALTHMYEQLGEASYANTKQLAGYATLLQAWIYEHFPTIGNRQVRDEYVEDDPRCMRYVVGSRLSLLASVRMQLDTISLGAVRWRPYEDHKGVRPFELISLFSGYIRLRACKQLYLPERVLRQHGYVQIIPRHPATMIDGDPSTTELDQRWLHFNDYVVQDVALATDVGACIPEYLEWFRSVSHPYIIQMTEGDRLR